MDNRERSKLKMDITEQNGMKIIIENNRQLLVIRLISAAIFKITRSKRLNITQNITYSEKETHSASLDFRTPKKECSRQFFCDKELNRQSKHGQ